MFYKNMNATDIKSKSSHHESNYSKMKSNSFDALDKKFENLSFNNEN
jgi:hypothetical protein